MRKEAIATAILGLSISITTPLMAGPVTISNTFTAGSPAKADEVNQNFSDVADAVNDNNTRISSNAAAVAQNSGNITTNATVIETNGNAISGLNTSVTTLSGVVGANSTAIGQNGTNITTNASSISTNSADIGGLNTTVTTLSGVVSANSTAVSDNAAAISTNSGLISGNTTAIGTNSTAITGLNTSVSSIDSRVTANEGDIATNSGDVTTLNSSVSGIDSRVTSNEGNIATNSGDITTLTNSVTGHETRISALEGGGGGGGSSNEISGDLGRLLTGTVSVSSSDTVVLGTGTLFSSELNVGDAISIDGEVHSVAAITSDAQLTLDVAHSTGASGAFAYTDNDLLLLKSGDTQERFAVDKSGHLIRRIQRATGLGPVDGTSNGQIVSRVLTVNKSRADTALRIGYSDNFLVHGNPGSCRWELRVDGLSCPGGTLIYDSYSSSTSIARYYPHSTFGYCEGISAGVNEIQVWVAPVPGQPVGNCSVGWNNSRWTLEAEEVY